MSLSVRARLLASEDGLSLVEGLVSFVVSGIVIGLLITSLFISQRTERYTARDSEALAELRVGFERLTKELRQARKVYTDSTGTSIRFWVDADRDNQQDQSERITWRSVVAGESNKLERTTDAGGSALPIVGSVVAGDIFEYEPDEPSVDLVTLVRVTLSADVRAESIPEQRTLRTEVRLRNAPR